MNTNPLKTAALLALDLATLAVAVPLFLYAVTSLGSGICAVYAAMALITANSTYTNRPHLLSLS